MDKIVINRRQRRFFSPSVSLSGIQVTGVGRLRLKKRAWSKAWRVRPNYSLSLIRRGRAVFKTREAGEFRLRQGDCLLVFPGRPYLFQPENNLSWDECFIQFQGPVVHTMENEGIISPSKPVFRLRRPTVIMNSFKTALETAFSRNSLKKRQLPGMVFRMLDGISLDRAFSPESRNESDDPVGKIIRKVRENPVKKWNFRELAESHGISYFYLIKRMKKTAGFPPHRFLSLERMKLASKMLASGMTVVATCRRVGMDDPYHFSRLFKKLMGRPPSAYRKAESKIAIVE